MPRYIHPGIAEDLLSNVTTFCFIKRVDPVTPGYDSYGVTDLDADVPYDDGSGAMVYSAAIGMETAEMRFKSDAGVDDTESTSLLPVFDIPVSEADIRAGVYDYARFRVMLVNYENLTPGRHVTLQEGTIGKVRVRSDGMSFVDEQRGLLAQLRQSLCEKDSLGCRAIFGSQPIGSATPGPQVAFGWCGFDATTLLVSAEVADVGLENTLTFQVDDATGWTEGHLNPGIVKFTSGMNNGRTYEIDTNTADGWITLQFEAAFPIAVGDTFDYRPDCSKVARDAAKGCMKHWEALWNLHFRGEPDIPVGQEGSLQTPGASVGPGGGGDTNVPFEAE